MKDFAGTPGTITGLILRMAQCIFAAGSVASMATTRNFFNITAFWYSLSPLLLSVVYWSLICFRWINVFWSFMTILPQICSSNLAFHQDCNLQLQILGIPWYHTICWFQLWKEWLGQKVSLMDLENCSLRVCCYSFSSFDCKLSAFFKSREKVSSNILSVSFDWENWWRKELQIVEYLFDRNLDLHQCTSGIPMISLVL